MNIYEVVSETLYNYQYMDYGPPEPYCIAELVIAKNPSQARYLAWKTDDDFTYDLTEMPAFSVHLCEKDIGVPCGIVTHDKRFQNCWT
jgi:hypothetical protein